MSKIFRRILAVVLVVSLFLTSIPSVFAATGEEYICELRLIYAEDYDAALDILSDSAFEDYKLFKNNLNENTDKIGVWLAYKTTDNIEDAITDLAVMQMNGGYQEGNYQEMIKKSYESYTATGDIYLDAIKYFKEAYEAEDFLATAAYRQLNFYTVKTQKDIGLSTPTFEGKLLGDIFLDGISKTELATIFMQGNTYALSSIRSLLAMGVSYNEDGETYLEKVGNAAAEMMEDPDVFEGEEYDEFAPVIAVTISVLKDMFEELEANADDLDYEDEEFTEDEIYFLESAAMADMLRNVTYIDDMTLYDFCLEYEMDEDDYSALYPLAAALNEGQLAMTKAARYYDVIRYSMPTLAEDEINAEIAKLEKTYSEKPFNVYTGVDRSVYTGTFALTNEAYRADAYTDTTSLLDSIFGNGLNTALIIGLDVVGLGLLIGGFAHYSAVDVPAKTAAIYNDAAIMMNHRFELMGQNTLTITNDGVTSTVTYEQFLTDCVTKCNPGDPYYGQAINVDSMSFLDKYDEVVMSMDEGTGLSSADIANFKEFAGRIDEARSYLGDNGAQLTDDEILQMASDNVSSGISVTTSLLCIAGGAMMLYSAYRLGKTVYNYYHPDYEDVPLAMIDLVETVDGDRYIKYDVVFNAETNKDGVYEAADLNAFEAQRWNALYYTKSYEAGKPLLANSFTCSTTSNKPKTNYAPVHRFGEIVCYDLNKYNFEGDTNIYLSVKQSRNQKSAVTDVPDVVGSIFANGLWLLIGSIGAIVGVGGTLGTEALLKKKRKKVTEES